MSGTTSRRRVRTTSTVTAGVAVAVGLSVSLIPAGNAETATAQTAAPPPIAVEPLTGFTDFTDDVSFTIRSRPDGRRSEVLHLRDPGRMLVARITVQPGARFPWHTHPGPVLVHVVDGGLVYQQASDCVERDYGVDDAFLDPGDKVHTAWNPSTDEVTELVAVFHAVPEGVALTIPEADQTDRCP